MQIQQKMTNHQRQWKQTPSTNECAYVDVFSHATVNRKHSTNVIIWDEIQVKHAPQWKHLRIPTKQVTWSDRTTTSKDNQCVPMLSNPVHTWTVKCFGIDVFVHVKVSTTTKEYIYIYIYIYMIPTQQLTRSDRTLSSKDNQCVPMLSNPIHMYSEVLWDWRQHTCEIVSTTMDQRQVTQRRTVKCEL